MKNEKNVVAPPKSRQIKGAGHNGNDPPSNSAAKLTFSNSTTELEHAVQRYVDLYEFAPFAYVSFDRVGRIKEINLSATQLFGRAKRLLIGDQFAALVNKDDRHAFRNHLARCRSSKNRVETDLRLKRPNGEMIFARLSSKRTTSSMRDGALLYQTAIVDLTERKQTEEIIRQSERRYRTLFDLVPVAVYTCDARGFIQEFNQHAVELWGRQPGRNGAKERYCGSFKIFYPDGRPMPHQKCPMARALRGDKLKPSDLEILVEQPSGARRSVIVSPKPLKDERGKIAGAINCLYDITPRKHAEAALRESEEQFRRAIEDAPIPVIVHAEDGQVLQISKTWTKLTGYTAKQIPSFDAWMNRAYGFGADEVRNRVHRLFKDKSGLVEAEFEIATRAGKRRRWAFSASSPGTLNDGRRFVVGMALDITARKRAEEELRQSEEQLRAIIDQTSAAMGRTDLKGRLTFVNDKFSKLLGYRRDELVGKTIQERTHPDDLSENVRLFKRMVTKGIPYEMDKRYIRKDGSVVWANVSASIIRNAIGKPESAVAVVLDISARKKAEASLRDAKLLLESRVAQRTAELLAANEELQNEISQRKQLEGEILEITDREQRRLGQDLHDSLCQHLTAIAFMARSVAMRLKNHRVADVQDIEKIADLINEGVTEARAVARGLHPVEMDSAGLVAALRTLGKTKRGEVQCFVEAEESLLIPDPAVALHLFRIAQEAVINANKHARAREIIVRMSSSPRWVELTVTDDGVGLPPDAENGSGMGFHLMRYRARSIRADFRITSTKPRGTRVFCRVPRT